MSTSTIQGLHASIVGSPTVLNDGTSPNTLTIALTNSNMFEGNSAETDIVIKAENKLALYFIADDTSGTVGKDQLKLNWALSSRARIKNAKAHLYLPGETVDYNKLKDQTSGWTLKPGQAPEPVDKEGKVVPNATISSMQGWELTPAADYTLKAGESLLVVISNIITGPPDGPSLGYMLLHYEGKNRFSKFGPVQKTPNIVSGDKVGIGTIDPWYPLSIVSKGYGTKISLWDETGPDNIFGIGVSPGQQNYVVKDTKDAHVFYAKGKNHDGSELLRIRGDGTTVIYGSVDIKSNTYSREKATFYKGAEILESLRVDGAAVMKKTLKIDGVVTGDGPLRVEGGLNVKGELKVNKGSDATFDGDMTILGDSTFQGDIKTLADLSMEGDLSVGGSTTLKKGLRVNGGISVSKESVIELGTGLKKEGNAGKIGYQVFSTNGLDIIGAGEGVGTRTIRLWDRVGINRENAGYGVLEVGGKGNKDYGPHGVQYLMPGTSGGNYWKNFTERYSIWASDSIGATKCLAWSDARIKNVIGLSDPGEDLSTLLQLKVTDYTKVDTIEDGMRPHKKLVAQEVKEVFAQAVSLSTGVLPDIYQKATANGEWIELATDLKPGDQVRIINADHTALMEVLEVEPDRFRISGVLTEEEVFVYGRQVDDFHAVDYDAIAMLNVSATQELYRQLEALRAAQERIQRQLDGFPKKLLNN